MNERRNIWQGLSTVHKKFVQDYLSGTLSIPVDMHENFLFPDYDKTLLNGSMMHDMQKTVERIFSAVEEGEHICIYGDYDCDGVPGSALLKDFFQKINYTNFSNYIPHRHNEGYGLHIAAIKNISNETNCKLLITIDLGTTNISEVDFANEIGVDVIVTDHHLPIENQDGQILPKAFSILNNKQYSCMYANKDLCGTGTIFKLVCELLKYMRTNPNFVKEQQLILPQNGYEKWLLDLVAIATIADMMPLTNENRTLAIYGLHVLSKTNRAGLLTIFKNSKVDIRNANETDVGFTIGPRVNSASRMAHPKIALSMFSSDLKESIEAAHQLEELNSQRKDLTKLIVKKIFKDLEKRILEERVLPEILVIGDKTWNVGVLGILASKILDKYNVNVFVWGSGAGDILKGSCRSRGDIHLVKLMTETKNIFEHFGGHELAGGFSISSENIFELETLLNKNIHSSKIKNMVEHRKEMSFRNSIEIELSKIDKFFLNALKLIGPFGLGNPRPIFKLINVDSFTFSMFGKSKEHLKIKLFSDSKKSSKNFTEAIKFFVDEDSVDEIISKLKNKELFFEIEAGWMTDEPRLKIL